VKVFHFIFTLPFSLVYS